MSEQTLEDAIAEALFHDDRLWFGFTDTHKELGGVTQARTAAAIVAARAVEQHQATLAAPIGHLFIERGFIRDQFGSTHAVQRDMSPSLWMFLAAILPTACDPATPATHCGASDCTDHGCQEA